MKFRRAFLLLILALWPHAAAAHPHIFVRYDVTIAPAAAGFVKLHFVFKIHALANPLLAPGAKAGDRPLLERNMLVNLAAHPFFLYLDMDGQSMGRQQVSPVPIESPGGDTYAFDLTLPDSISNFDFALYDPSYFDFVSLTDAGAVKVKWNKVACTITTQDVAKTVWGVLSTQYVQCASKNGPRPAMPRLHLDNQPAGEPAPNSDDYMGRREMVP